MFPAEFFGELITLLEERYHATKVSPTGEEESSGGASSARTSRRRMSRPGSLLLRTLRRGRRQSGAGAAGKADPQFTAPAGVVSRAGGCMVEVVSHGHSAPPADKV